MKTLKYHTTHPYPCGYLPERMARSEVIAPDYPMDTATYGKLMKKGYRRSGHFIYRPQCEQCHACLSVRVKVDAFVPNRSQRRSWKKHQHLNARQQALHFEKEHFMLYQRYQTARHAGGSMDHDSSQQYENFLLQSNVSSKLVAFYEKKQLCMVSFIDELPDGLSSVYTFYDPDIKQASFGTYNILWQIQLCRTLGLNYLYLGYWIKAHNKMSYKTNFQPLEILRGNQWLPFQQIMDKL
ncbi:arginyltransferase [Nitrosomonas aestuarii]|uniref:arginyltransferase n=1 Tax=Nitrosomonas aestuarii TaxID=52441 RepID=UPI000D420DFC|nr:arginyltransferase [Nitrosomonas aestuarii]PTN12071.1 arginine-tRNA-protein transferase [Nitrosomonas aestuarii]